MPNLTINGQSHFADAPPDTPLLWVLREDLRLTGTKYGCGVGLCGSCTVHIDGHAVRSCSVTVGSVEGALITTIEGLSPTGTHPVQQAWIEHQVPQCGYCQSGQIMQADTFEEPEPQRAANRRWYERQSLPMRHLLAHRRCRETSRRDHEPSCRKYE
jgi:isoquinoline 1-oxidoreductase alpha subunit